MIGRPKVPLVLTTPEQQALDSLAHRARRLKNRPRPRSLVERALSWRVRVVWTTKPWPRSCVSLPRWWAAGAPAL